MIDQTSEMSATLERYAEKWISEGYRLVLNPHGSELPTFLGSYRPDAILLPPDSKSEAIAVEVLYKGQQDAVRKLDALRHLLDGQRGWRLEVVYAGIAPSTLSPTSPHRLRETLDRIGTLKPDDPGAFLLLWPVLEAAARILAPGSTKRPQSPGRVVELLAAEGYVLPSDADVLRRSADLRNRLIHGELETEVSPYLRRETERIARDLVASLQPPMLSV